MTLATHVDALHDALRHLDIARVETMGAQLAATLGRGGRLLVAGNGGSAAHAQHLTAELVGRYQEHNRVAYSAIALHAETSSVTAIANDYGWKDVFARQVIAHGRAGDIFLAISTSGGSVNLLHAARAARREMLGVWALTGRAPNPLASCASEAITIDAPTTATVQEVHQVVVHLLCEVVDRVAVGTPS
jgi:D-sedoheptulose 7-phosphate isomerase